MRTPLRFTITRQELYDLVWTKTLAKAAAELGITKAGLGHLCGMNKVPRPSSLFWRHKAIGKPEEPTPLPNPENNFQIELRPGLLCVRDPLFREEAAEEVNRITTSGLFKVGADLRGCHRLVSQSRHLLLASKSYDKGIVLPPEGCLDIRVSKGEMQRALLLMEAIIRGFESLGHRVRVAGEGRGETVVEVLGSEVSFVIREYWAMKEQKNENGDPLTGKHGISRQYGGVDLIPSGRLRIEINGCQLRTDRYGMFCHYLIPEIKTKPMEARLKEFAIAVINTVARAKEEEALEKIREEKEQEANKRKEEEERRREAKWKEIRIEQARVDALIEESEDWAKSNHLRDYIDAKKADYIARGVSIDPASEAGTWLKWALNQADRLDPLAKSPPSILDDEDKYSPKDDN
jgi:hypothetical protein